MLNLLEGNKILQTLFLVVFGLAIVIFIRMNNDQDKLYNNVNNQEKETFYIKENLPKNLENDIEQFQNNEKSELLKEDSHLENGRCKIGQWSSWDMGSRVCKDCIPSLCKDGYFKRPAGISVDNCKSMTEMQCRQNQASGLSCNTACEPCKLPANSIRVGDADSDLKGVEQPDSHSNIGKVCYFKCKNGYILGGNETNKKCMKKPIMCNTDIHIKSNYGTGSYLEICGFKTKGCTLYDKNTIYDVKTNKSNKNLLKGWNQEYDSNCKDHWYWKRACKRWSESKYKTCQFSKWVRRKCRKSCGVCKTNPKFPVGTPGGNIWKIILKDSVLRPISYKWRVKQDNEELAVFPSLKGIPLRYGDRVYIQNQLEINKTYLDVCGRDQFCNKDSLSVQTWNTPNRFGVTGEWIILSTPYSGSGPIEGEGQFVSEGDPIYIQNAYTGFKNSRTYLDVCGKGTENCSDCAYGVVSHPSHNKSNIEISSALWSLVNV